MSWSDDGARPTLRNGTEKPVKLQDEHYNCGPVALVNALEAMGIERSVEETVKLCKTTPTKGTTGPNLLRAAQSVAGTDPWILTSGNWTMSWLALRQALDQGSAAVLCAKSEEEGDHYVAAIGVCGLNILVHDPANGVYSYSEAELKEIWNGGGRQPHWALVL